jgi:1-acyl-sn-glycerol-3-phosphate acyltransferase
MRRLALLLMRLRRWTFVGEPPAQRSFVAIGVPHTSNWDFVVFLAVARHFGFRPKVLGKHTLVRWPLGLLMRRLGVIAVRRDRPEGLVGQAVEAFRADPELVLVIAPEGTRAPAPFWRSGFYHIAVGAGVPIAVCVVDGPTRRAGIAGTVHPTGNPRADMDRIRALLAGARGYVPHRAGRMRLPEEGG